MQSSIGRQFGLAPDKRRITPAEEGISEMMVDVYRSFEEPLSDAVLFSWHRMLFERRGGLQDIGRYRTGAEPMEIVSGPIHEPQVHFEAPLSTKAPEEMARFLDWFNGAAPSGSDPLPALTRAGIAHLHLESIHPFEDGNGRIGRAIAEKALAQDFGQPALTALAATILLRRKAYYRALHTANKSNEVTAWLRGSQASQSKRRDALRLKSSSSWKKHACSIGCAEKLNPRQDKALLRMLREGPDGFKGGLSAGNYATITHASPATTTRDLADLVEKSALRREGERRYARYHLAISIPRAPSEDYLSSRR